MATAQRMAPTIAVARQNPDSSTAAGRYSRSLVLPSQLVCMHTVAAFMAARQRLAHAC
jgi:hypothetical protein